MIRPGSQGVGGFTLVESAVALLIVAIAYTAVSTAVGQFVDQRSLLMERHGAHRVAWNRMMDQHLLNLGVKLDEPRFGENTGVVRMSGRQWHWQILREQTATRGMVRVDVRVGIGVVDEDGFSRNLTGFLVREL
jgi:type II secretion system protein I